MNNTIESKLLSSGYFCDDNIGSYLKEEDNGDLHTYLEIDDNIWSYEMYDQNDNVVETKIFTIDPNSNDGVTIR